MNEQRVCQECGAEMAQFTNDQPQVGFRCKNGHVHYFITFTETLDAKFGVGLHETSEATVSGKPAHERRECFPYDGTTSRYEVSRSEQDTNIHIEAKGKPNRSGEELEIDVGALFIAEYNRTVGSNYTTPRKHCEQASPIDLICERANSSPSIEIPNEELRTDLSANIGESLHDAPIARKGTGRSSRQDALLMQVTVADDRLWAALAKGDTFVSTENSDEAFKAIIQSIRRKEKYGRVAARNIVLLLDGWPVVPESVLNEFKVTNRTVLSESGFREIWYVPRNGMQRPTRLW